MTHRDRDTAGTAQPQLAGQEELPAPAGNPQRFSLGRLTRAGSFPLLVSSFLVVVLFIIGTMLLQGFASFASVDALLILSSFLGVAAIGETIAVLLGGVDLAIPFVIGMSNVLAAQLAQDGIPFWLAAVTALAAGTVVGCFNGYVSSRLRVHPLIVTLGVGYAAQAAVEIWTKGAPSGVSPHWLLQVTSTGSKIAGIHLAPVVILWLVVSAAVIIGLRRSPIGRRIYAVGANPVAAELALIKPVRIWTAGFGISGFFAALAGVLLLGFTGGTLATVGDPYLFLAVGAVVVGGTSLAGGRGSYLGTIIGAVLITLLDTVLVGLGATAAVQQLLIGVVIIAAVSLFGREAHVRDRV
jgi:ribose transport system permease protein